LRLTGEQTAAEDLVQETLLSGWKSFEQFEDGTNARAWLFRILINTRNAQHRRKTGVLVQLPPDLAATRGPDSVEIQQALDRLSDAHRSVLLLAVIEGFSCREISDILSLPMGTVMSRLSRAREAMREVLTARQGVVE
jgi:RNA polymerase sigma-70 factor (ECF subfamily)